MRPTHFSIYKHGTPNQICPSQVNLMIRTDAGILYSLIDYVLYLLTLSNPFGNENVVTND